MILLKLKSVAWFFYFEYALEQVNSKPMSIKAKFKMIQTHCSYLFHSFHFMGTFVPVHLLMLMFVDIYRSIYMNREMNWNMHNLFMVYRHEYMLLDMVWHRYLLDLHLNLLLLLFTTMALPSDYDPVY